MSLAPCTLSDDDLVAKIEALAAAERRATASLIAHLAELEARQLQLAYGFRTLFGYCRHVLHCSEHEAYNRMEVVHAARRFPVILRLLSEGLLHLTAVRLLAPHLADEDHLALLGGAIHKSRREVVKLIARWFPSADSPSSVRKLPAEPSVAAAEALISSPMQRAAVGVTGRVSALAGPAVDLATTAPVLNAQPRAPISPRADVLPLSAERYRLQVTIDGASHADLLCLQDLMRREIPTGDPAVIVARALELLRREVEKRTFSATSRPRPAPGAPPAPRSRHIPAHVERAVWDRDQGQCAFEGGGRRCEERSFLEFHHVTPWIVGGAPSVENIALRCRAHNAYEAAVYFGPIREAKGKRRDSSGNESASPVARSGAGR